jgi:hypothetical protein
MCESRSLIVRGNLRSDITRRAALWEAANVEPREIRLKSVRAPDFAGAAISSHLWEWRHRWNVHYESAGADLIQFASLLLLHSPSFSFILPSVHVHIATILFASSLSSYKYTSTLGSALGVLCKKQRDPSMFRPLTNNTLALVSHLSYVLELRLHRYGKHRCSCAAPAAGVWRGIVSLRPAATRPGTRVQALGRRFLRAREIVAVA